MSNTIELPLGRSRHCDDSPSGSEPRRPEKQSHAQRNYARAVASGFYQRDVRGLEGKFDNVRRYWEDQITRYVLHPFVVPLVQRKRRSLDRIRILDLGAGSGEGFELLSNLKKQGESLPARELDLMPMETIGEYKGLDISPAMVEQGNEIYRSNPKVHFAEADLADGLGAARNDAPYDIYFSSYSSLSHLRDEGLIQLLTDICEHIDGSCVLVADLLGRYSFEWQCYWDQPTDESNMRQYSMSYLYPAEMLDQIEVERFPMRYWGALEFDRLFNRIAREKGVTITNRQLSDRSLVVGRHVNTAEYNPYVRPIRQAVNSLHALDRRTDLQELVFDYIPKPGFDELNHFFERLQMAWNTVVFEAIDALDHPAAQRERSLDAEDGYPEPVQEAVRTIRNVVGNCQWFRMGDPRANIVEPQLGYVLRNLEMDLQQGLGCGHGLLAIYELTSAS